MKILYLHQYFATPASNAGTRSYEMAKRLVAKGHEVTFVTTSAYLSNDYKLSSGWNFIEIDGIKLHVLHSSYSNKDSFLKRMFKFFQFSYLSTLKAFSVDSEVVLATSTPLTIAIPGLLYSKFKKVSMVFEVRDLWPELPVAVGVIKNPLIIKLAELLERYTYKNSTRLIGLSPGMCEGITRHGIDKNKVTLATNSCDTQLFDVNKNIGENYKKESLSFLNGRKLVVYTGTFGLINDVVYLAELARKMESIDKDICFIAIGDGMKKQDIIEKARFLGVLDSNFYVLDPVPKVELVKLLSAANLSVSLFGPVPEMWHNSANKLFDALASITPVAINYGGWQKQFIEEHKCGLVLDSKNYMESANQISEFLKDDAGYSEAKKMCNYLAYHEFSREKMADRVEKALLEAVND